MLEMNWTDVTEFLILGFRYDPVYSPILFAFFLSIYILTFTGNLLIIISVARVPSLKSPMHFFLTQLSLCDIFLTTDITPNMLRVIINGGSSISFTSCMAQIYVYGASTAAEVFLLTLMSYDRYLAICLPLRYAAIMTFTLQMSLVSFSWIFTCTFVLMFIYFVWNLHFCHSHVIDHYFCDLGPLLELSCSDKTIIEYLTFFIIISMVLLPFSFVLFTYVSIFITILGIPSSIKKQKAFSTCSSHLIVVSAYYGTIITTYLAPSKGQFNVNKVASLLYTTGTPLFNAIIYSLRNQEFRKAFMKYVSINYKELYIRKH